MQGINPSISASISNAGWMSNLTSTITNIDRYPAPLGDNPGFILTVQVPTLPAGTSTKFEALGVVKFYKTSDQSYVPGSTSILWAVANYPESVSGGYKWTPYIIDYDNQLQTKYTGQSYTINTIDTYNSGFAATFVAGTDYDIILTTATNTKVNTVVSTVKAMTYPGALSSVTGSNAGGGTARAAWTANQNSGGSSNKYYACRLFYSNGTFYGSVFVQNTTQATIYTGSSGGTFYWKVATGNEVGFTYPEVQSNTFTVSSTVPPPIFIPPPPIFSCIQGDTLIRTINGYLKARDIAVGQKLATYAFDELQYSDPEYDVWSWSANSMSNSSLQETNVIEVKKNIADKTMIFNNDMSKRFSLEHIMLVKRDGIYSFMDSKDIKINDYLVYDINNSTQDTLVESINFIDEETDIYDIIVDDYNLIIAGNILTHK